MSEAENNKLRVIRILLKVLAWCILVVGIVFSFFHASANLFSMMIFIGFIIVIFAVLYALSLIIKLLGDLYREKTQEH